MALSRRRALIGCACITLAACVGAGAGPSSHYGGEETLRVLERRAKGRLGAYILNTDTGRGFGWRETERFAMASSFKLSLAAMILRLADEGRANLSETLTWSEADLVRYSPVTERYIESGLSVEDLARAIVVQSDNSAANILMRRFGGPGAVTAFWRSIGDEISRLDGYEPELNIVPPGTSLNTTSPLAMAGTLNALAFGDVLSLDRRNLLRNWMIDVKTGRRRLRAGLPEDWIAGDKTGTSVTDNGDTYVDIGYGGPAGQAPLIITAFFEPEYPGEPIDASAERVLADVARIAVAMFAD